MERFGVKLKTGKVLWVSADEVEVHDGMVLFMARTETGKQTMAGFSIAVIDHFGRPEAFGSADAPSN